MSNQKNLFFLTSAVALGALLLMSGPAKADFISILNFSENTAGTGSGPFGVVDVALTNSTSAHITFTADPGFYFIDSNIADAQVNASSFTVGGTFSATAAPGSTGSAAGLSVSCPGGMNCPGNVNGYGTFNLVLNNMDGTAQALQELDFDVTNTSGTWATVNDVLTTQSGGFDAAAHVLVCPGAPTSTVQSCANNFTGFVAETPVITTTQATIPEPSTMALLGGGLAALGLFRRRRKSA